MITKKEIRRAVLKARSELDGETAALASRLSAAEFLISKAMREQRMSAFICLLTMRLM